MATMYIVWWTNDGAFGRRVKAAFDNKEDAMEYYKRVSIQEGVAECGYMPVELPDMLSGKKLYD